LERVFEDAVAAPGALCPQFDSVLFMILDSNVAVVAQVFARESLGCVFSERLLLSRRSNETVRAVSDSTAKCSFGWSIALRTAVKG
jgi:hypothetical protein